MVAHPSTQMIAYSVNVVLAPKMFIMGRNVMPITKLLLQFVVVARPEPRDRTRSGNNSDCCQGTVPRPEAYAATYRIRLSRRTIDQVPLALRIPSGLEVRCDWLGGMNMNATLHASRPRTMKGMVRRSILRRPTLSIRAKATRVKTKLVSAMDREVPMGDVKPTRLKIVAEKYINEFYSTSATARIGFGQHIQSHTVVANLGACRR